MIKYCRVEPILNSNNLRIILSPKRMAKNKAGDFSNEFISGERQRDPFWFRLFLHVLVRYPRTPRWSHTVNRPRLPKLAAFIVPDIHTKVVNWNSRYTDSVIVFGAMSMNKINCFRSLFVRNFSYYSMPEHFSSLQLFGICQWAVGVNFLPFMHSARGWMAFIFYNVDFYTDGQKTNSLLLHSMEMFTQQRP